MDYLAVAKQVNHLELYKQAATMAKVPVPKDSMRSAKFFDGVTWDGKDAKPTPPDSRCVFNVAARGQEET